MNRSKNFLFLFTVLISLLALSISCDLSADSSSDVPRISVAEVKQRLGSSDMIIIDVRKTRNWWSSSKKILSATRENPSKVSQWIGKYAKDQTLVFYCA
jgi:hypothetical protein